MFVIPRFLKTKLLFLRFGKNECFVKKSHKEDSYREGGLVKNQL